MLEAKTRLPNHAPLAPTARRRSPVPWIAATLGGALTSCTPTPSTPATSAATPSATPPAPVVPAAPEAAPIEPAAPIDPAGAAKPGTALAARAPSCPPQLPSDTTLADRLDVAQTACGGVLLVTRDDGLHALTPALEPIARVRDKRVRQVKARKEGDARSLYYFAADAPDLVRLDLRTGAEEVLVSLPRLSHRCFTSAEPGEKAPPADPVDAIQSASDLDLDLDGGVLCVNVGDRNENMASIRVNLRADLRTRKVEQRTVFVTDECKKGAGREQEAACEPAPKDLPESTEVPGLGSYGLVSPSGRWAYYTDEMFEQSGDYIYYAAFVYDTQTKEAHAITPTGLVKIDLAARDPEKGPPEGTCYIPGEAQGRWLPGRDVLIVEGCGSAGWLIVEPPGRVQAVAGAYAVTTYP